MTGESVEQAAPGMFYVCDSCGHIEVRDAVPEGDEWTCETCGNHAAWEFPPAKGAAARSHSLHVSRAYQSGLFRRV